jgi:spore maturation protein CgeB
MRDPLTPSWPLAYRNVLFLGDSSDDGTAQHRANAMRRLGIRVTVIDPARVVPWRWLAGIWLWRTGGIFLEWAVRNRVMARVENGEFDLVYVEGGSMVGPSLVRLLRQSFGPVVNYNVDNPFCRRDRLRWKIYLRALPQYDLVVVVREANLQAASAAGARSVLKVWRSADEEAHSPRQISADEKARWRSDVLFVGTWMPERGPLLARLAELGVPVSIYGNRWQRAPEWPTLSRFWRGPAIYGDDLARAIQSAAICLGLVSHGNLDLSTQRSFEIPYLGGLFCAERTTEHVSLYREDEEAVFWNTPEECAEKVFSLLSDEPRRAQIARRGRERCIANGTTNEMVAKKILEQMQTLQHRRGLCPDNMLTPQRAV